MRIDIEPYPIQPNIKYIRVRMDNFELDADDAWVSVTEYDKEDKFLHMSRVYIPHEVYAEWGQDDNYIVEYAMRQLGFEKKRELTFSFLTEYYEDGLRI